MNEKSKLEADDKENIQQSKTEIRDSSDIYTEIDEVEDKADKNKIFRSYENVKSFSNNNTKKSKLPKRKSIPFHKLVFLTIVLGSISLGIALPVIENFITAQAAAYSIFEVIDNVPSIDYRKSGVIPETFEENIVFKNVRFEYPTRPGVTKIHEKVDEDYVPPKKREMNDRKISRAFSVVGEIKKSQAHQFLLDFYKLLQINSSEKCYLIFGIFASMIVGVTFPCTSLIYSQMFQKMINNNNKAKIITKINDNHYALSTSLIINTRKIQNVNYS